METYKVCLGGSKEKLKQVLVSDRRVLCSPDYSKHFVVLYHASSDASHQSPNGMSHQQPPTYEN